MAQLVMERAVTATDRSWDRGVVSPVRFTAVQLSCRPPGSAPSALSAARRFLGVWQAPQWPDPRTR